MRDIFTKVERLEGLLTDLSESLKMTELKRYTANQILKAENVNVAEGATLTINMNNALFSVTLINECLNIVNDLKPYIPKNGNTLNEAIEHHREQLVSLALVNNGFRQIDAAKRLGITHRRLRYLMSKNPKHFKLLKEKENCDGSNQKENVELGTAGRY